MFVFEQGEDSIRHPEYTTDTISVKNWDSP